ncbi:uncharacterized protein BO95DRAFT_353036, partial [Aspergillus brunneoviolaceus CBS 621.78]
IQLFKSSIEVFIFFILKKNKNFRLYINYRKLNKILVKNYYFLFLILEILDKIIEAKYFFKLDI